MAKKLLDVFLLLCGALFAASVVVSALGYQLLGFTAVSVGYYFVLPGLLAAVCLGALFLPARHKAMVAVNVLAVFVALGLASWLVPRLLNRTRGEATAPTGGRVRHVLELRAAGRDVFPAFSPTNVLLRPEEHGGYERDGEDIALRPEFSLDGQAIVPLTGPANRWTVLCREEAEFILYQTDEMGFANPPGLWSADSVPVCVVGDSYVHGHCVSFDRTLVARIRDRIPGAVNLGVEGTGPLAQLAILREYAARLRPRFVVWVYFENDLYDLEEERRVSIYRSYLEPAFSQELWERRARVEDVVARYLEGSLERRSRGERRLRHSPALSRRLVRLLHPAGLRTAVGRLHSHAAANVPTFERTLERARDDVHAWGGEMIFAYLPSWTYFHSSIGFADFYRRRNRKAVLESVDRLGIPVVDLLEVFRSAEDPERFFLGADRHYTELGYEVAAEALVEAVSTRQRGLGDGD